MSTNVRAALGQLEESGTEQGAREALEVHPWLSTVPVAVLLREAVRLHPTPGVRTLALSVAWEEKLEQAALRLVRITGSADAGAREVLSIAWGQHLLDAPRRRGRSSRPRSPFSLGGYAVLLRKRANAWRRRKGPRGNRADRRRVVDELARLQAKGLA